MKKFGIAVLLLAAFMLTACSSSYTAKIRIPWKDTRETLTYSVKVMPSSAAEDSLEEGYYSYTAPYDNMDYSVTPHRERSVGEYTTTIDFSAATEQYTVTTELSFRAVYPTSLSPLIAAAGTPLPENPDFVYFDNTITTEAAYSGRNFGKMIYSIKTVTITEVTCYKENGTVHYNEPLALDYRISAAYNDGTYAYGFFAGPAYTAPYTKITELYGIAGSGAFDAGGIDNEILLYYIRAVEMTEDNYSQISMGVSVSDPYSGQALSLSFVYQAGVEITRDPRVLEIPENGVTIDKYKCTRLFLSASGDRTGHGTYLYYALNDSLSQSIPGYPLRRQQKLIRMQQGYLQYDLTARA